MCLCVCVCVCVCVWDHTYEVHVTHEPCLLVALLLSGLAKQLLASARSGEGTSTALGGYDRDEHMRAHTNKQNTVYEGEGQ